MNDQWSAWTRTIDETRHTFVASFLDFTIYYTRHLQRDSNLVLEIRICAHQSTGMPLAEMQSVVLPYRGLRTGDVVEGIVEEWWAQQLANRLLGRKVPSSFAKNYHLPLNL
jgi:hypothetical protein